MAVIGLSDEPEHIWCVAGWAFRQLFEDVMSSYPDDAEMARAFELAGYNAGLHIDLESPELAARLTNAIQRTVADILSGAKQTGLVNKEYGDLATVEQYRNALVELLAIFPKPEGPMKS